MPVAAAIGPIIKLIMSLLGGAGAQWAGGKGLGMLAGKMGGSALGRGVTQAGKLGSTQLGGMGTFMGGMLGTEAAIDAFANEAPEPTLDSLYGMESPPANSENTQMMQRAKQEAGLRDLLAEMGVDIEDLINQGEPGRMI